MVKRKKNLNKTRRRNIKKINHC